MTRGGAALVVAALTVLPPASHGAEVRPVAVAGYDAGGDKIATVTFDSGRTDSLTANEGIYVGGGVSVVNDARNFEFQGTASAKFIQIRASNGEVRWTRVPLDALLFYRAEKFRLGGGLTFVTHTKLKASGGTPDLFAPPGEAVGMVLQGDYFLGPHVALGLRATLIDYKSGGSTVNGSGVGVSFSFTF